MALQQLFGGPVMDHFPQGIVDQHQLIDTGTTPLTGLIEVLATNRPEHLVGMPVNQAEH